MSLRTGIRIIHVVAGLVAFATVCLYLASTLVTEILGEATAIMQVKALILAGLVVLIPSLIAAAMSGRVLAGANPRGLAATKLKRMKIAASTGVLLLIPAAIFLSAKAAAGEHDAAFWIVQLVEFAAGAVNATLLGLNLRDGMRMTRRLSGSHPLQG